MVIFKLLSSTSPNSVFAAHPAAAVLSHIANTQNIIRNSVAVPLVAERRSSMPKMKTVSQCLGTGRGSFRKSLLTILLNKHSKRDAFEVAKKELGNRCVYCGDKNARLQSDLLRPATIGGLFVPGNVVPACPSCNSDRGSKHWEKYIRTSNRVALEKSADEIEKQVTEIRSYMKKYGTKEEPNI